MGKKQLCGVQLQIATQYFQNNTSNLFLYQNQNFYVCFFPFEAKTTRAISILERKRCFKMYMFNSFTTNSLYTRNHALSPPIPCLQGNMSFHHQSPVYREHDYFNMNLPSRGLIMKRLNLWEYVLNIKAHDIIIGSLVGIKASSCIFL